LLHLNFDATLVRLSVFISFALIPHRTWIKIYELHVANKFSNNASSSEKLTGLDSITP